MDDSATRFRVKYISKTVAYYAPKGARRCYVRHVKLVIKEHTYMRLAGTTAKNVTQYWK